MKVYTKKFRKKENPFIVKKGGMRDAKLTAGYRLQWTEEGFLGEREAETSGEKIGRNISYQKVSWLLILLVGSLLLLVARTAYLQIYQGDYYQELADYNRIRKQSIKADRGIIYDSKRNILAYNIPVFYLQVIPADILSSEARGYDKEEIANIVGDILGEEVEEALDYILIKHRGKTLESYQPQVIADHIDHTKAMQLILRTQNMPGVSIEARAQRKYTLPSLSFSQVVGYTGIITPEEYRHLKSTYSLIDYLGKIGLEKVWERELRGQPGKKYIEVDALGKEKRVINKAAQQDGYNLVLGINSGLQQKIEQEIIKQLEQTGTERAAAVILNPNNGEVMALVSIPSFDSNDFADKISSEKYQQLVSDENRPLFNRAVSGEFPIGSTFKPIVAAAALQENLITKNTTVNSVGGIGVKSWFFSDWKTGGHGITNVRQALAWSVNTFFYYIGGGLPKKGSGDEEFVGGLGVKKITDYARLFGLGDSLGIDLPNEAAGFLPSKEWKEEVKKERWYIGDTYHLAIGQGDINATPLQVAALTMFFANGGTLYQPHVVKELLDSNDESVKVIEPEILRHNFIDKQHIETVRKGLRDAVVYGSAQSLQSVSAAVAGKTGTAQWSSIRRSHSWFTGWAPYENPEIVITVLIEEGGEASEAAVPVARRVLEWYFSNQKSDIGFQISDIGLSEF